MSKQKTVGQIQQTPAIVSMMMVSPGDGRPTVDVVAFADGRVLVIGRDGIELWPDMDALLNSDPQGDFAEMIGFIEYEEGPLPPYPRGVSWRESARFGKAVYSGLAGSRIRVLEDGRLHLRDGRYLTLEPYGVSLWDDDVDEAFGYLGGIAWEVA